MNSGDKAVNSIRFSSDGLETDSVLRLEFQPDRSLTVSSAEFTFYIREPPKVEVASSAASDAKALVRVEEKASTPSAVDAPEGDNGADGVPPGNVLIKRSMIEITQKTVRSRLRRQLRKEESIDMQDRPSEEDRILDTPAMETRYIDPQAIHKIPSDIDTGAAQPAAADTGPMRSGSGEASIQDPPADVPETEAILEEEQFDMGGPPREEATPSDRLISRETPAVRDDGPVLEKPETPSAGQPEEFFSAPTHPSSRKRKHPVTYTSTTRTSKKKPKVESPTREEEDSDETNSDDDAESNVVPAAFSPSKNTKQTPKSKSGRTPETSSTLKKGQQQRKKTRLSGSSAESTGKYDGPPPRVVFSNSIIPSQSKYMNFLKKHNVKLVDALSKSSMDMVCVGNGELRRTYKLTLGVLLGKTIVTDKWVIDSHQAGHLLNPIPYLPHDPEHEKQWNFNLHEAIERGKREIRVFQGWTIHFTPSFIHQEPKEVLTELTVLVRTAGGKVVTSRSFPKQSSPDTEGGSALIIAVPGTKDDDTESLTKAGWTLYSRDIVSLSILRGKVEVNSEEFKIHVNSGVGDRAAGGGGAKEKKGR